MATMVDRGDTETGSTTGPDRILEPGATCWRLARADRLAIVVDAAAYFRALKDAILRARHSVLLIGWDFDMRIALAPDEHSDVPDQLGEFLSHVVDTNPDVRIRVLRWDLSLVKMPLRATLPLALLDMLKGPRIVLRLDHAHPAAACHHQKIAVIDDALAFCGGIDVTLGRWDTSAHRDEDPHRVHPSGDSYGPWHDATVAVSGEAARILGELARARWQTATGERLPAPDRREPLWPEGLEVDIRDADVAVARTQPAYRKEPEIREIEALYLRAIAMARRWIYIETQYFASQRIADAIAERLREPDGPEIVIVNPVTADGWLEEKAMGSARAILVRELSRIAPVDRFRIYHPVNACGTEIYVHAKIMIVDDVLVRVGSSNLNNRSMGFDTEADLALEAGRPEETRFVAQLRDRLLAEHLATTPEAVAAALEEGGSLISAIERLRRAGRTLSITSCRRSPRRRRRSPAAAWPILTGRRAWRPRSRRPGGQRGERAGGRGGCRAGMRSCADFDRSCGMSGGAATVRIGVLAEGPERAPRRTVALSASRRRGGAPVRRASDVGDRGAARWRRVRDPFPRGRRREGRACGGGSPG